MESKFKTNIKCSACVAKVTPFLNDTVGENKWVVDLASPQRTLTVTGAADEVQVQEALKKAGYNAEKV